MLPFTGRSPICPYCLAIMQKLQQGKLPIDVCIACGTRWFDHEVLAPMVDVHDPRPRTGWEDTADPAEVEHTCPRCRTPSLLPRKLGAVSFRRCTTCAGVEIASSNLDVVMRELQGPGTRLPNALRELLALAPPTVSA